jgi:hypothetical protein
MTSPPPQRSQSTTLAFRIPGLVHRRLEDVCRRRGVSVAAAVRMMLEGAVQRDDFNWSPWDGSETDNGYMPYEAFKKKQAKPRKRSVPKESARHLMANRTLLTLAEVSAQFNVTQRTAYRWYDRVGEGGSIDHLVR